MTARHALWQGTLKSWLSDETQPLWITLTEPSKATLDLPGFSKRWNATIKRLRRMWGISEYALSVEFQKRGALHPHVIAWAPAQVAADLADRKSRASYRRRMHELRPAAQKLGWGRMVDAQAIRDVDGCQEVSRYGAKNVADYATKEAAKHFKRAGAKKVRPIRLSYGFYPGGLARARERVLLDQRMDATKDPGPWRRSRTIACGS